MLARLDTMEPAVEVLRVPNMYVGAIIGQQGSKIVELQRVSTARITIEKEQNDPRTITVSGTASTVAAAVNMINDTLDAEKLRLSSKRGLGHSSPGQPPANLAGAALHWQGRAPPPAGSTEIEVPVLASRCGVVIGRGGENIRDVQQRSGAHVQLSFPVDGETHRTITISGSEAQVAVAKQRLDELLHSSDAGLAPGFAAGMPPHLQGPGAPETAAGAAEPELEVEVEVHASSQALQMLLGTPAMQQQLHASGVQAQVRRAKDGEGLRPVRLRGGAARVHGACHRVAEARGFPINH